ncbi:expressed unknown protein [Seminavis robusta]|uniref:Uncharacterized protein n=1 Tax=Seminavis robusta TaxID=568900 RepID=A0A9N8H0V2_9STRA|nr:expressed unknown protein [Seminavis robusta]|eukprot:Sro27_g018300.1 n/a (369) ;mRNA; r:121501-122803
MATARLPFSIISSVFECIYHNKPPIPELQLKIVPVGPTSFKLTPPSFEFEDGLYVLYKTRRPLDFSEIPSHLRHLVASPEATKPSDWRLSGPQYPKTASQFQQRYCYPEGREEYCGTKGGVMWTMYRPDGREDTMVRLFHVYHTFKRLSNKIAKATAKSIDPSNLVSRSKLSLSDAGTTANQFNGSIRMPITEQNRSRINISFHNFVDLTGPRHGSRSKRKIENSDNSSRSSHSPNTTKRSRKSREHQWQRQCRDQCPEPPQRTSASSRCDNASGTAVDNDEILLFHYLLSIEEPISEFVDQGEVELSFRERSGLVGVGKDKETLRRICLMAHRNQFCIIGKEALQYPDYPIVEYDGSQPLDQFCTNE